MIEVGVLRLHDPIIILDAKSTIRTLGSKFTENTTKKWIKKYEIKKNDSESASHVMEFDSESAPHVMEFDSESAPHVMEYDS